MQDILLDEISFKSKTHEIEQNIDQKHLDSTTVQNWKSEKNNREWVSFKDFPSKIQVCLSVIR